MPCPRRVERWCLTFSMIVVVVMAMVMVVVPVVVVPVVVVPVVVVPVVVALVAFDRRDQRRQCGSEQRK